MAFQTHNLTLDSDLRSMNAVAISTATTTNGTSLDLTGAADAFAKFAVVIDWSGLDFANADELYRIQVQGATATGFGTVYVLEERRLGATGAAFNVQPVSTTAVGRVVLYCDNVVSTSSTDANSLSAMRWVRVSCVSSGTSPAITLTAHIVPLP